MQRRMPRGPRLDAAGALHHVMARGIERREIFIDDRDREDFLARLAGLVAATGTRIFAWCLIPNHFHLLVRSGAAGLSAFMRRLQTGYAVTFNRRHRRVGHLFQNRYKSILVEEEPYLLELVRYLHLNPLRAGLVQGMRGLDSFPWSGHAALLGLREAAWQDTAFVLGQFGRDEVRARRAYRQFVTEGVRQGRREELSGGGLVRSAGGWEAIEKLRRGRERWAHDDRVLGSSEFVVEVMEQAGLQSEEGRVRIGEAERAGFLERLGREIAEKFQVAPEELTSGSRRRRVVVARAALGWIATRMCGIPTGEVARATRVTTVSVLRLEERGRAAIAGQGVEVDRLIRKCK